MQTETNKKVIFTDKQIQNFVGFFNAIKRVHVRLIREGYIIKNGRIIKPPINKAGIL